MNTHVSPRRGNELLRADRAYRSGGGLAWLLARAPAGVFHRMLDRIDAGLALGTIEGHLPDGGIRILGGRGKGPVAIVHLHHWAALVRSEEHTSELQSLMRISYAVFCLKKKTKS